MCDTQEGSNSTGLKEDEGDVRMAKAEQIPRCQRTGADMLDTAYMYSAWYTGSVFGSQTKKQYRTHQSNLAQRCHTTVRAPSRTGLPRGQQSAILSRTVEHQIQKSACDQTGGKAMHSPGMFILQIATVSNPSAARASPELKRP